MKKFSETLKNVVSVVLVIGLVFGAGCAYTNYKNSQPKEVVESGDKEFDLKLP